MGLLSECLVFSFEALSLVHHSLNLFLAQTTFVVSDGDLLHLAAALLKGGHVKDAVGVEVESDFNLRLAAAHGRDTAQLEGTQAVAVLSLGTLTLKDLDQNSRLTISVG